LQAHDSLLVILASKIHYIHHFNATHFIQIFMLYLQIKRSGLQLIVKVCFKFAGINE